MVHCAGVGSVSLSFSVADGSKSSTVSAGGESALYTSKTRCEDCVDALIIQSSFSFSLSVATDLFT